MPQGLEPASIATEHRRERYASKGRIIDVVTDAASPLATFKKDTVVTGAEQTVAGTGWLPGCLRIRTDEAGRTGATPDTNRVSGEPAVTA